MNSLVVTRRNGVGVGTKSLLRLMGHSPSNPELSCLLSPPIPHSPLQPSPPCQFPIISYLFPFFSFPPCFSSPSCRPIFPAYLPSIPPSLPPFQLSLLLSLSLALSLSCSSSLALALSLSHTSLTLTISLFFFPLLYFSPSLSLSSLLSPPSSLSCSFFLLPASYNCAHFTTISSPISWQPLGSSIFGMSNRVLSTAANLSQVSCIFHTYWQTHDMLSMLLNRSMPNECRCSLYQVFLFPHFNACCYCKLCILFLLLALFQCLVNVHTIYLITLTSTSTVLILSLSSVSISLCFIYSNLHIRILTTHAFRSPPLPCVAPSTCEIGNHWQDQTMVLMTNPCRAMLQMVLISPQHFTRPRCTPHLTLLLALKCF